MKIRTLVWGGFFFFRFFCFLFFFSFLAVHVDCVPDTIVKEIMYDRELAMHVLRSQAGLMWAVPLCSVHNTMTRGRLRCIVSVLSDACSLGRIWCVDVARSLTWWPAAQKRPTVPFVHVCTLMPLVPTGTHHRAPCRTVVTD